MGLTREAIPLYQWARSTNQEALPLYRECIPLMPVVLLMYEKAVLLMQDLLTLYQEALLLYGRSFLQCRRPSRYLLVMLYWEAIPLMREVVTEQHRDRGTVQRGTCGPPASKK